MWAPTYVGGATLVLDPDVEPVRALQMIERHRITNFSAVPVIWEMLVQNPRFGDFDLSSLQIIGSGGAWRWGDTQSATGLVRHILRADYGVFELSLHTENPEVLDQWARAVETVGTAVGGALPTGPTSAALVLVVVAAVALPRPEPVRPGLWRPVR